MDCSDWFTRHAVGIAGEDDGPMCCSAELDEDRENGNSFRSIDLQPQSSSQLWCYMSLFQTS